MKFKFKVLNNKYRISEWAGFQVWKFLITRLIKPPKISPREEKLAFSFPLANFQVFLNPPCDEEILIPEICARVFKKIFSKKNSQFTAKFEISSWVMRKSDFWSLVQSTISQIFFNGIEIYQ